MVMFIKKMKLIFSLMGDMLFIRCFIAHQITADKHNALRYLLKSDFLSMKTNLLIYKMLIHPVLTHALETWILRAKKEKFGGLFESRVFRGIHENGDDWHMRRNTKLYRMFKKPNVK